MKEICEIQKRELERLLNMSYEICQKLTLNNYQECGLEDEGWCDLIWKYNEKDLEIILVHLCDGLDKLSIDYREKEVLFLKYDSGEDLFYDIVFRESPWKEEFDKLYYSVQFAPPRNLDY